MRLLIKKLKENAVIPARQTEFSAGYDLCACTDAPVTIKAGQTEKIHTGISAEVQGEKNCVLLIYARSSLASKFGIAPANCVGVVDWDYRGEIMRSPQQFRQGLHNKQWRQDRTACDNPCFHSRSRGSNRAFRYRAWCRRLWLNRQIRMVKTAYENLQR